MQRQSLIKDIEWIFCRAAYLLIIVKYMKLGLNLIEVLTLGKEIINLFLFSHVQGNTVLVTCLSFQTLVPLLLIQPAHLLSCMCDACKKMHPCHKWRATCTIIFTAKVAIRVIRMAQRRDVNFIEVSLNLLWSITNGACYGIKIATILYYFQNNTLYLVALNCTSCLQVHLHAHVQCEQESPQKQGWPNKTDFSGCYQATLCLNWLINVYCICTIVHVVLVYNLWLCLSQPEWNIILLICKCDYSSAIIFRNWIQIPQNTFYLLRKKTISDSVIVSTTCL